MFVSDNLGVNASGNLTIGGVDTVALAKKYGTPLYVMDEDMIRRDCKTFCYASKAFSCKEIYRVMQSENMGIDVVSGGELYTAVQAGFDVTKACFHGNNKTTEELNMALDYGVGRIVVDNIYEMEHLNQLAAEKHLTAPILLRINQIDCQSCEFIFVDHGKHLHLSICYQFFHYMQGLFLLFRKCFIIQIIKLPFIFCAFIGNVYKFHFFSPA